MSTTSAKVAGSSKSRWFANRKHFVHPSRAMGPAPDDIVILEPIQVGLQYLSAEACNCLCGILPAVATCEFRVVRP
jgi:hypothetical protein